MSERLSDLAMMPAHELGPLFRSGAVSPVEATKAVLDQIEQLNPAINAFCWLDSEAALKAAKASEDRYRKGAPLSVLDGVTTTVKDLSVMAGWPTRRGSRAIPAEGPWLEDSPSVARMRDAGAVLLGKTTVSEFGATGSTKSFLCGITRNPHDPAHTPGGSSGGAAASLAAGMGTIALGSDAAGSIRTPSSYCGVFGLKTTFGRVPDYPCSYLGSFAVVGPMTRTVKDAAFCMNAITQPDSRDLYALPPPGIDYAAALEGGVKGMRIAYSPTLGFGDVDPEVAALVADGVKLLASLGAEIEIVEHIFDDPVSFFGPMMAPGMANAFRIFGFTAEQKALMHPKLIASADNGGKVTALDYVTAREKMEALGARMRAFHETYDLLVTPTISVPALAADQDEPTDPRYSGLKNWKPFSIFPNITHQPAASVPVGTTKDGLPVGMQVVGPLYGDDVVLRACHALEMARPFPRADLARVRRFPPDQSVPQGIASQREAMSALVPA